MIGGRYEKVLDWVEMVSLSVQVFVVNILAQMDILKTTQVELTICSWVVSPYALFLQHFLFLGC
jgi:hypothetical protein